MAMNADHFHTHGPDELAMLRAECDKWHKAYDRVWEERMRFADRAIYLEKENSNLKRDNEQLLLRADNWKSLCVAGEKNIAELEKKFQEAESGSPMLPINRWKKCSEELPPHDTWCLVYHEGEIDSDHYTDDCNSHDRFVMYGPFVTHWMPLPKPPEADK